VGIVHGDTSIAFHMGDTAHLPATSISATKAHFLTRYQTETV
jgi:hypothetical protein